MAKRKMKRKNCPGNYLPKTPEASTKFIKRWERVKDESGQPVTTAAQIKVGVGGLKTEKDANLAKIKFKQAMDVKAHFDKKITQYEAKLAQHKENMRQWKECKAKGIDPAECLKELGLSAEMLKRPSKPTGKSHATKGCAGNYKTPSKHSSVRYLKHFFRQLRPDVKKFIPDDSGVFAMLKSKKKVGPRGSLGNFVPRVREAMEIVGVAETAKIANDAVSSAIIKALEQVEALEKKLAKSDENMGKAEANQVKKLEVVKKRLEARKEKLAKERDKLNGYLAAVQSRRARARKGRRLLRRKK